MKRSLQRQPTFFWQGVLILLPVVVLAGAAVISLRQDQILARHEATERAEALAQQAADAIWAKLTARESLDQFKDHTFRVDADGKLTFPPPAPALPVPQVLDVSALTSAQREAWLVLKRTEAESPPLDNAIAASRKFLDSNPPELFAAVAQFSLARWLAARGQSAEAKAAFSVVRERFPEAISESGIPLGPLAELKSLELTARDSTSNALATIALNSFCSNLVNRPTFLTAHLLTQAAALQSSLGAENIVEPWQREWLRQEPLRELATAALAEWAKTPLRDSAERQPGLRHRHAPVPALSWFQARDLSPNPQPILASGNGDDPETGASQASSRNTVAAMIATSELASVSSTVEPVKPPKQHMGEVRFTPDCNREWLATRIDDNQSGYAIVCRAMGFVGVGFKDKLGSPAWLDLRSSLPALPPWLGVTIDLAGVPLLSTNDLQVLVYETAGKGSGQSWRKVVTGYSQEVLATAPRLENGIERLRVQVHLVSRDMLFGRQRTRSYLFGLLIAASSSAALIGFVSARRAFVRQQQLSAMKSNFVSGVSHELRAPIASVRLLAESLERGRIAEPAKQNEYFRFIVQECRRLSSLIENVLDFARIEQGRKQYEFEPTDVLALVGKTVKLLEPVAAEKQVTLRTQLPTADAASFPPPVLDAAAIQQALINLLDNAVKHSPSGAEVTVGLDWLARGSGQRQAGLGDARSDDVPPSSGAADDVSAKDTSLSGRGEDGQSIDPVPHFLRLWVQDSGRGIPPTEHQRIFERFYRPGSEMRRETQGVGIGLSIVKHIVEAHCGRVWVESEVGQGSRFTIELPLQPERK